MPVVVTGADQLVGAATARALAGRDLDVRATVGDRTAVDELVALGVKTAVWREGDDVERLGAVFEGAYTVLHLRGGIRGALASLGDVLDAAEDSGVARIVTLAPMGAGSVMLEALRGSGYDAVVLRVAAVVSEDGGEFVDLANARIASIRLEDLVAALLAADRLRDLHGYREIDAVGPDVGNAASYSSRKRRWWQRQPPPVDLTGDGGRALAEVLGVRPVGFRPTR